ncbi:hypothetical protein QV13_01765 [Mesorhizobium hungaricum]|uniref:Uncharacterized protein n=1 Tax=Mesorhizobium hungaricum TaxID=1566387 RepID=A0A1C2ED19_9HYPH|nr:hypothetical protein QV13_01765 [Mesorhizobium hungaricum]
MLARSNDAAGEFAAIASNILSHLVDPSPKLRQRVSRTQGIQVIPKPIGIFDRSLKGSPNDIGV